MRHCTCLPPPPRPFRDAQLRRLQAPTLLLAAELNFLGGGAAAAERARQVIPRCEAYVLRGARHFISSRWVREATRRVAGFFYELGLMQPHGTACRPRLQLQPQLQDGAGAAAAGAPGERGSAALRAAQPPAAGKAAAGRASSPAVSAANPAPPPPATLPMQAALPGAQKEHGAEAAPAAMVVAEA
ncbi:hypothetical protein ABPG75_003174 [Micractinium tetrahymenae]